MRNTTSGRLALGVLVLSLFTIGLAAPATAAGCGEEVEGLAIGDMTTLDLGELWVEDTTLHVRKAYLEYDAVDLVGDIPLDRVAYTINYSVDLETGKGLMWGTWKSLEPAGVRGIHFGKVFDFVSPEQMSFEARTIGRGNGMLIVLRTSSDTAGGLVHLAGTIYR